VSAAGLGVPIGVACAAGGVGVLRLAWRHPVVRPWLWAGWMLLAAGLFGWGMVAGADMALALGFLAPSLAGYALLAASARVRRGRTKKPPRAEVELPAANGPPWRAWLRFLFAGPLAALAAVGVGTAVALRTPWDEADRLVAGGMLLPALWSLGMIWATSDARLARIGLGLAAVSAAGFALAAL
jgi:hypothetical protein